MEIDTGRLPGTLDVLLSAAIAFTVDDGEDEPFEVVTRRVDPVDLSSILELELRPSHAASLKFVIEQVANVDGAFLWMESEAKGSWLFVTAAGGIGSKSGVFLADRLVKGSIFDDDEELYENEFGDRPTDASACGYCHSIWGTKDLNISCGDCSDVFLSSDPFRVALSEQIIELNGEDMTDILRVIEGEEARFMLPTVQLDNVRRS
ncbi:hypothetical protein SLH49_11520 [Cognatiyoonia sp. IB215446]|uniref:hypothetical protein n=1 Tax=Cognatiyoonia sp. IB215446 TaxID=3097355 RepID=UPI002A0BC6FA|nr:hypothetical protein [Cognatiyoonia sp. IB215446]MDX8348613.1 hypothetical protein [Cognatiyoonia sp. IB215446]